MPLCRDRRVCVAVAAQIASVGGVAGCRAGGRSHDICEHTVRGFGMGIVRPADVGMGGAGAGRSSVMRPYIPVVAQGRDRRVGVAVAAVSAGVGGVAGCCTGRSGHNVFEHAVCRFGMRIVRLAYAGMDGISAVRLCVVRPVRPSMDIKGIR